MRRKTERPDPIVHGTFYVDRQGRCFQEHQRDPVEFADKIARTGMPVVVMSRDEAADEPLVVGTGVMALLVLNKLSLELVGPPTLAVWAANQASAALRSDPSGWDFGAPLTWVFTGYDDDPRELPEIPEVTDFARCLVRFHPAAFRAFVDEDAPAVTACSPDLSLRHDVVNGRVKMLALAFPDLWRVRRGVASCNIAEARERLSRLLEMVQ